MANAKFYEQLKNIRAEDKFPNQELEKQIIDKIFPKDAEELSLKLSNVTAGFYGFVLKNVGKQCGWDKVDSISKSLFIELGQLKTIEAQEKCIDIPKDTRALAIIFISAVYTSSPEYKFEIFKLTPEETLMRIFGASRYYRIAKELNIETHISWPVLIPFFEGIARQVGIECKIEIDSKILENNGRYNYLARFILI